MFRPDLERDVPRSERSNGSRPPYDHVLIFRVLILQSSHSLSDERTEYLIKDRLSFMRFLRLSLAQSLPDANSIWKFREALTRAKIYGKPAIEVLFTRFDAALTKAGFLAICGEIIDATIVVAPKHLNTDVVKKYIKEGLIPARWPVEHPTLGPIRILNLWLTHAFGHAPRSCSTQLTSMRSYKLYLILVYLQECVVIL